MNPIVLYTHAINWEDPWGSSGEKAKNHQMDGQTDEMTDAQGSVYRPNLQSRSKNSIILSINRQRRFIGIVSTLF